MYCQARIVSAGADVGEDIPRALLFHFRESSQDAITALLFHAQLPRVLHPENRRGPLQILFPSSRC